MRRSIGHRSDRAAARRAAKAPQSRPKAPTPRDDEAASLLLADGTRFDGDGIGYDALALGEAVCFTGMTGYEEALPNPSYAVRCSRSRIR